MRCSHAELPASAREGRGRLSSQTHGVERGEVHVPVVAGQDPRRAGRPALAQAHPRHGATVLVVEDTVVPELVGEVVAAVAVEGMRRLAAVPAVVRVDAYRSAGAAMRGRGARPVLSLSCSRYTDA